MSFQRIQYRQDTSIRWSVVNPVLSSGEPGYETDTGRWKVGDGESKWSALTYRAEAGPPGGIGPVGPAGPSGARGVPGVAGPQGPAGAAGPATVLQIGTVASGDTPAVTLTGVPPLQTIDFVLPAGAKGATGPAGAPASLSIGSVASGGSASATIGGTAPNYTMNLVLPNGPTGPQGAKGDQGIQGIQGIQGTKGDTGAAAVIRGTITAWPPSSTPTVNDLWIMGSTIPSGAPAGTLAGDGFVWTGTAWTNVGPIRGPKGDTGAQGLTGSQGLQGPAGPANTIKIGYAQAGATPDASLTGTAPNQTLNLVLPKGDKGDVGLKGDQGTVGPAGPPNTLAVGTVTQGAPGSSPAVTITGNAPAQTVSFVLPKPADPITPALTIGSVTQGQTASATVTGTAPNFTLNLVLPAPSSAQSVSFTQSPEPVSASDGQEVVFRALAQATDSPIVYKWQSSTNGISWSDIAGAGSSSYLVKATLALNGIRYRCVATTPQAGSAYSLAATLTVGPAVVVDVNGKVWSQPTLNYQRPSAAVAYNGLWVGNNGTYRSLTATNWSVWTAGTYSPPSANLSSGRMSLCAGPTGVVGAIIGVISGTYYVNTLTTSDGMNWVPRATNNPSFGFTYSGLTLPAMAYGTGKYVMFWTYRSTGAGNPLSLRISTSVDGITWTAVTPPTTALTSINSVIFANGLFVAVGNGIEFLTSPDGVTWTVRQMPSAQNWTDIVYSAGSFTVLCAGLKVATGTTGTTFTQADMPASADWSSITATSTNLVAVAKDTTSTMYTVGAVRTLGSIGQLAKWSWVGYGGGVLLALSEDGYSSQCDGSSAATVLFSTQPRDATVLENQTATFSVVVAGLPAGATYQWQKSTDGTTWANHTSSGASTSMTVTLAMTGTYYRCLVMQGATVVATSASALLVVLADLSAKPITWTNNSTLGGDRLLCGDNVQISDLSATELIVRTQPANGRLITSKGGSTDGITWTPHVGMPDLWAPDPTLGGLVAWNRSNAYYFNGRYIIGRGRVDSTYQAKSILSSDGRNWTVNGLNNIDGVYGVVGTELHFYDRYSSTAKKTSDGLTATTIGGDANPVFRRTIGVVAAASNESSGGKYVSSVTVSGVLKLSVQELALGFESGSKSGFPVHVLFTVTGKYISTDGGETWSFETNSVGYTGFAPVYGNGMWVMPAKNASGVYYTSSDLVTWYTYTNLPGQAVGPAIFFNGKFLVPIGTPYVRTDPFSHSLTSYAIS